MLLNQKEIIKSEKEDFWKTRRISHLPKRIHQPLQCCRANQEHSGVFPVWGYVDVHCRDLVSLLSLDL